MNGNERKFDGKASAYEAGRPAYAEELVDLILEACGVRAGDRVADVGAGTGIFTEQLLKRGLRVTAVEPNADMRSALGRRCGKYGGFGISEGNASATGLADGCVKLVTAAQAFHWFSPEEFRAECARVTGGGYAAIVYNNRLPCELNDCLNEICARFPERRRRPGENEGEIAAFFGGKFRTFRASNPVSCDREKLIHTVLSRSYAPVRGEAGYEEAKQEIGALFDGMQCGGEVVMQYESVAFVGKMSVGETV